MICLSSSSCLCSHYAGLTLVADSALVRRGVVHGLCHAWICRIGGSSMQLRFRRRQQWPSSSKDPFRRRVCFLEGVSMVIPAVKETQNR